MIARILGLMLAALLLGGAKPVLVPDVSQRDIEIVYSFTGAELLLFGAILYPDRSLPDPDADPAEIVVVVRGPVQSVMMRQKEKIAGIWVNAESMRYRSVPSFYAIASSKPIERIVDERTRAIYELGLDSLQLSPITSAPADLQTRFVQGLIDLRRRTGLFVEAPESVEITDGVLYRARITIPARVPVGRFTAETFLIRDGRVLAAAVREIDIRKSGFERFVARAAENQSVLYGLIAVALSVLFGWGAGALWRRF
ncbi:TIGR02186 family protein [Sphingomonas qomolangmaensis]|uniref:TIGR02186 family protein n=1 Tax=Sphingomonas qomolangmaensis TaxID=2918765 RepID=A0ABY5LE26_9SPHN|nr:TIGR02186 family protein [Sphingomonas qomolangmaensis]UUL82966.1 TIGR02186 family protein [Sphingomonas qomolangmaensis]